MQAASTVPSGQPGPRYALVERALERHRLGTHRAPIARHTRAAFEEVRRAWADDERPLVLDSGCGTGESTLRLADRHPGARVLGIDKSAVRLAGREPEPRPAVRWVRAELGDFWRLARQAGWRVAHHYLLYPNPWPKAAHLGRRWHAHPAFVDFAEISDEIELRTNWRVYALEMAHALRALGFQVALSSYPGAPALSPFERKYQASGHDSWRVQAHR